MRRLTLRASFAAMAAVAVLAPISAAQDPARASDEKKHPITITGCVRAGVDAGTFGLAKEVDRRVEVVGTVDLTDLHKAQMKITDDQTEKMDQKIEIKGDQQTVRVETDTKPGVAPDTWVRPLP